MGDEVVLEDVRRELAPETGFFVPLFGEVFIAHHGWGEAVHALEPAGLEYSLVLILRRQLVCGDGRHGRAKAVAGNVDSFQLALRGIVQMRVATGEGRIGLTETV